MSRGYRFPPRQELSATTPLDPGKEKLEDKIFEIERCLLIRKRI